MGEEFLGLGFGELLFLAILVLIFIDHRRIPEITRSIGRFLQQTRQTVSEFYRLVEEEARGLKDSDESAPEAEEAGPSPALPRARDAVVFAPPAPQRTAPEAADAPEAVPHAYDAVASALPAPPGAVPEEAADAPEAVFHTPGAVALVPPAPPGVAPEAADALPAARVSRTRRFGRLFGRRRKKANKSKEMSVLEHLAELRRRLLYSLAVLGVAVVGAFAFSDGILALLLNLIKRVPGITVQAIEIPEKFTTSLQLALIAGIAVAMPFIVYQVWRFVRPGLENKEPLMVAIGLPLVMVFFVGGVLFSYFVALPAALGFLLTFGTTQVVTQPRLQPMVTFVANLLLWSGISFETPIFLFFLALFGVVDWRRLSRWRRYAFPIICVIAAVITPTSDPVNMMVIAIPLYLLYEIGILLARIAQAVTSKQESEENALADSPALPSDSQSAGSS